jgi:hypothetical protein
MKRGMLTPVSIALVAVVIIFGAWALIYPSTNDPKNLRYVLWKTGVYRMNPDMATETMIGDAGRDKLVIGKTDSQLRGRFGFLLEPAEASQYLRSCYQSSPWKDRRVLFIRNGPWMVVFEGDKATNLVLIKGC